MHSTRRRWWPYALAIFVGVFTGLLLFLFIRTRDIEDRTRQWVVGELQQRFQSDVQLDHLHVRIAPTMGVSGEGLSLRNHNRSDLAPMFLVQKFSFDLGILGMLRARHRISHIHVENLTITIPAGREKKPASKEDRKPPPLPRVIADEIVINNADLVIVPKKEGKEPLDFAIHNLVLKSVGADEPFEFQGRLTNAKPQGEIATHGRFGPWDADQPGDTPVTGAYKFTNADLGPFPGIAGILSSTGKYRGRLNEIQVEGQTDTPDFSLDAVGKPVPLRTEYSATVDGTDGDTYLHPVNATLIHTLIVSNGSIVRAKEKKDRVITLDVVCQKGRLEDLLQLAMKADKPFMTGTLDLKTKFLLPPGREKVLDKLNLDGEFSVTDGQWTSEDLRGKIESLSRHAEGKPKDTEAGSAVSDLRGHFRLSSGVVTFADLTFSVPGAAVLLKGDYDLRSEALNFNGELRLKAKLSQTVTGAKSFFLKAVDPFFAKKGAGALIPISVTGTREAPVIGLTVFHKKMEKKLGAGKTGQEKSAGGNGKTGQK